MISFTDIFAYAFALGIATAVPGAGMTALAARSVGSGARAGYAMLCGLILGDLLYLSFAVFGLAVIADSFGALFTLIRWASIAYLLYLAWQFWTAEYYDMSGDGNTQHEQSSAVATGLTITLRDPKTIAFYLALSPLVLDMSNITLVSWAGLLVPVTIMVLLAVGSFFILGAVAVRQTFSSAQMQKRLQRGAAITMAGVATNLILRGI